MSIIPYFSLECIIIPSHLLSINHKCTHPCITAVQTTIIVWSFLKTVRNHLPMKLKIRYYSAGVYLFA